MLFFTLVILALSSQASLSESSSPPDILSRIKDTAKCQRFVTTLRGNEEVPIVNTNGQCKGSLRLSANKNRLTYRIGCEGLTGAPHAAHIHQGAAGINGDVVIPLVLTGEKNGRVVEGSIRSRDIGDKEFKNLVSLFFAGEAYFNIHTIENPSGEVRGQINASMGCLEKEDGGVVEGICRLPKETGPCKALKPRWYYNANTGNCESFNYGGCQGNGNRFRSENACLNACGGATPSGEGEPEDNFCLLEPEKGPCKARKPRWHYSAKTGNCELFEYGGCRGNDNNFYSKEKCFNACGGAPPSGEGEAGDNFCLFKPETGPCKAQFRRWYYNAETGNCNIFQYGGCDGNDNNFDSPDECARVCGGDKGADMGFVKIQP